MQESTTYQKILRDGRIEGRAQGRAEGERRMILRQGTRRFGAPGAAVVAALEAIDDRIVDDQVRDWAGLLGIA